MLGNLEPEDKVMSYKNEMYSKIESIIEKLGWNDTDDVVIDVGGVAATGTATHPDANPKWAKPFGTVSYQNDAFIVIKNRNRNPYQPSKPMSENAH